MHDGNASLLLFAAVALAVALFALRWGLRQRALAADWERKARLAAADRDAYATHGPPHGTVREIPCTHPRRFHVIRGGAA